MSEALLTGRQLFACDPQRLRPRTMSRPRASPPSRVGPLNGRKLSHQYLLCERRDSAGVNRPGASAAPHGADASLQCRHSLSPPPPPLSSFFFYPRPEQLLGRQADRLGPPTVVFDLIASSARELVPSTPPAPAPPRRCRQDTVRNI